MKWNEINVQGAPACTMCGEEPARFALVIGGVEASTKLCERCWQIALESD